MSAESVLGDARGRDPPTNERDEFVCARRCPDESRCRRTVPIPYLSCYQHDRSAPIASGGPSEDRTRTARKDQ